MSFYRFPKLHFLSQCFFDVNNISEPSVVALLQFFVRFVETSKAGHHLRFASDVVLGAEIHALLRDRHAANVTPGNLDSAEQQVEIVQLQRYGTSSNLYNDASLLEQPQVIPERMLHANRVDDQVQRVLVLGQRIRILRDDKVGSTQFPGERFLSGAGRDYSDLVAHGFRQHHAHLTQTSKA